MECLIKKTIFVFGDSNTWGYRPDNDGKGFPKRWDNETRWTGAAQKILGADYLLLADGLNSRTTVWEDPTQDGRRGVAQLLPLMESNSPFDLLIIYLGVNDFKARFGIDAPEVAKGISVLAEKALAYRRAFTGEPKILLICPQPIGPVENGRSAHTYAGGREKSKRLAGFLEETAASFNPNNVNYFDAGTVVKSSELDGVHLGAEAHAALGAAVAGEIKRILSRT